MKTHIERNDQDYREAVNYDGRNYYNAPMTITAKNTKYILSAGNSDQLTIKAKSKGLLFILAENSGLDYISLTVIDTKNKAVIDEYFCGNGELSYNPFKLKRSIFDYSQAFKIRVLSQYI